MTVRARRFGVTLAGMLAVVAACLGGCKFSAPPDPNDPADIGVLQIDVLRKQLQWASDNMNERVAKGEVSDKDGQRLLSQYADELLSHVKVNDYSPTDAWQYGEVFRLAKHWADAQKAYETSIAAVIKSKNEDRRVNDTLRLAQVLGELNQPKEAIAKAKTVFDAKDQDAAPILPAVLYEIVPSCQQKGADVELSKLLEEAIHAHARVVVNPKTDAGKMFLAARAFHMRKAWDKVVELLENAGKPDLAAAARERGYQMMASRRSL